MSMYADLATNEELIKRSVLNEAYFGRTPGIMRCYNAFSNWRSKYVGRGVINSVRHIDLDHDKDLHTFCKEMEREFGLDSFSFIVINNPTVNAGTYPILFKANRKPSDNVEVKNGYRFKPGVEMSIIICAYTGLVLNEKISDEEAFAVVLHEVGHNFQEYLNGNVHTLTSVKGFAGFIQVILDIMTRPQNIIKDLKALILTTNSSHKAISRIFNSITKEEDRNNVYSYFNFIRGIAKLPVDIAQAIMIPFLLPVLKLASGAMSIVGKLSILGSLMGAHGYLGEVMADNFATYYGFGEAQATCLEKLESGGPVTAFIRDVPIVGHVYNFAMLPGDLLVSLGDEHPAHSARAYNMLQSMKHDLNDPKLSPELRKKLSKEIDDYQTTMNKIYADKSRVENARFVQGLIDKAIFDNGSVRYTWNSSLWGDPAKEASKATERLRESTDFLSDIKFI